MTHFKYKLFKSLLCMYIFFANDKFCEIPNVNIVGKRKRGDPYMKIK